MLGICIAVAMLWLMWVAWLLWVIADAKLELMQARREAVKMGLMDPPDGIRGWIEWLFRRP